MQFEILEQPLIVIDTYMLQDSLEILLVQLQEQLMDDLLSRINLQTELHLLWKVMLAH